MPGDSRLIVLLKRMDAVLERKRGYLAVAYGVESEQAFNLLRDRCKQIKVEFRESGGKGDRTIYIRDMQTYLKEKKILENTALTNTHEFLKQIKIYVKFLFQSGSFRDDDEDTIVAVTGNGPNTEMNLRSFETLVNGVFPLPPKK